MFRRLRYRPWACSRPWAYRVADWLSVGVGVVALYGILDQKAAVNNLAPNLPDGKLKIEDDDWTYQVNAGVLLEPREGTRFGVTYLSKGELEFTDRPEFKGLGPGIEAVLRNRGLLDAKLDLEMNMPQAVMFSVFHQVTSRFALLGNLSWQDWSEFGQVNVAVRSEDTASLTIKKNYKDTWHTALGAQYRAVDPLLLSAGFAYDSSIMDDDERTPNLPLGDSWRFGLGARYDWSQNLALSGAYELLWMGDLDMDVNRGPLAGRVSGSYARAAMHFLNVNLNWKF